MRERDLFGAVPRRPTARGGSIDITLHLHLDRDLSWLVSDTGDLADAKWLPKSQAQRGEGRDEFVWTMPEWIAVDRGWV